MKKKEEEGKVRARRVASGKRERTNLGRPRVDEDEDLLQDRSKNGLKFLKINDKGSVSRKEMGKRKERRD